MNSPADASSACTLMHEWHLHARVGDDWANVASRGPHVEYNVVSQRNKHLSGITFVPGTRQPTVGIRPGNSGMSTIVQVCGRALVQRPHH